jgi:hypothetical protein
MKMALGKYLLLRYEATFEGESATKLAVAVTNYLFCDEPPADATEARSFAAKHQAMIESKARELADDESVCRVLTCAAYNLCYGKYVDSGRKVGLLINPYLGFVRALQEVINGNESAEFLYSPYSKVGRDNVEPLMKLWGLGLYRPLPYTPDPKTMMDEIIKFGRSIGLALAA